MSQDLANIQVVLLHTIRFLQRNDEDDDQEKLL